MIRLTRSAGTQCLRWLVIPATFVVVAALSAVAQDQPNTSDRNQFDKYRSGAEAVGKDAKPVFDKYAKWYASRLAAADKLPPGADQGFSFWVNDLAKRLQVASHNTPGEPLFYSRLRPEQRPFVDEFGKACVEALEPATQSGSLAIRINAARMISEVCRSGCADAADACLKILAKPDESDAVKLYALEGLRNLFYIVPDPQFPMKSVFQKDDSGSLTPLEQKSIQALGDFVFRQPAGDLSADDVDAQFYVRRAAVRGLALVRVQDVRVKGAVTDQPALKLLKVARGDGLNPKSNTPEGPDYRSSGERIEAIVGFCNLFFPKTHRDFNIDYAVYHVGQAMHDIALLYKPNDAMTSTAWKVSAQKLREGLNTWHDRAAAAKWQDALMIKNLLDAVDLNVLQAIEQAQAGTPPNAAAVREWVQQNKPKSDRLFKNDPKSTISIP